VPRRIIRIDGVELVEHFDAERRSDHSTRFVAQHLRVAPGSAAAEVGCGTGVLAMVAARRGARRVWATDVDAQCVALLRAAALENRLPQVRAEAGSLLAPVPRSERLDLVVAVLPQKPALVRFSQRYAGGADGAELLVALVDAAAARLRRGARLVLYHHSLAAPSRVEAALGRAFVWRTVAERIRCLSREHYASLAPGMLDHLLALAGRGTIQVEERGAFLLWTCRVLEAVRR
jgi:methylase of polypeptide subunit release factors